MRTGIKLKDASHTACAIIAKCDYLITTDKRLIKYRDNQIKIINPIEFLKIWGGIMMYGDVQTAAIISAGMKLLRENLGTVETEIFIAKINSNDFDYTKWRENLWEDLTPKELFERAAKAEERYGVPKRVERI